MKMYERIYAFLFMTALLGFSLCNILVQSKDIANDVSKLNVPKSRVGMEKYMDDIDNILTDNLCGNRFFKETYGAVYKALGKNEENRFAYIRDPKGVLHYTDFKNTNDISEFELALRVKRLDDAASKQDAKVVFLLYPSRYDSKKDEGYYGMPYRDMNTYADNFLMYLRRYNIDYIDYREVFEEQGKSMEDIMCVTDHPWKMEVGFDAVKYLVEYMDGKYNAGFDPMGIYTDRNNYVTETYYKNYLGDIGRETGEIYSELEDFTIISPVFETKFHRMYEDIDYTKTEVTGDFNNVIMNKKYLYYEDVYNRELFNTYIGGIYRVERITNLLDNSGPKVMFLRDSYSSPVGAFLAPMCSDINMYWSKYCYENYLEEKMLDEEPDYIFVAFTPDRLLSENFTFYVTEAE